MTYPPPPGQWKPGASEPGPPQPPSGYYAPPGWNPQPPPQKQSGLKWLLIGLSVLMVIAIAIGGTLLFTRGGSGPGGTTTSAAPANVNDVASAGDTGPVTIITSDPTCSGWKVVHGMLADAQSNGWGDRDQSSESSSWSPQVKAQYEAVGAAMRSAADRAVGLAKQSPHRVMRELYEQTIAYGRAYADSLSSYQPADDQLALVNINLDDAIVGVCNAIDRGGIVARTSSVPAAQSPTKTQSVGDVSDPERFVSEPSSSCAEWVKANSDFAQRLADEDRQDRSIPAAAWSPDRRAIEESAARTYDSYARIMENLGRQRGATFEDLATLAALYLRLYAAAIPTYTVPDSYAATPALRINSAVNAACKAAAG